MHFCITGGNGFIGRYLIVALSREGHKISVLTRKATDAFPRNVRVVVGDLTKQDCPLDRFLSGCDVLFHCAGEIHNDEMMKLLHVEGTKRLIQAVKNEIACTGKGIHWVQLSSVGAYGPARNGPQTDRTITENSENHPENEYEITKTVSDQLVIQASSSDGMTYSILRPSNVFGSKTTNQSLRRLITMVKSGLFFYIGKRGATSTYVHVEDVVAALIICGLDKRAHGQIYNLSQDCKLEELVEYVADSLSIRKPFIRIPEPLVGIPFAVLTMLVGKWAHIPGYKIFILRTSYSAKKIETELEFSFAKSMAERISDLIKEF